jgi:hypothetical protein
VTRGTRSPVSAYAVGFARPDRQSWAQPADQAVSWHAVEAHRPPDELDGEVELAVCGAIVQVWGSQQWDRVRSGRSVCAQCCQRTTPALRTAG